MSAVWGLVPYADLQTSWFGKKPGRFVSRTWNLTVNVVLYDQYSLIYAFSQLKCLPLLLKRIKAKSIPDILISLDWAGRLWYLLFVSQRPVASTSSATSLMSRTDFPPCISAYGFGSLAVESQVMRGGAFHIL